MSRVRVRVRVGRAVAHILLVALVDVCTKQADVASLRFEKRESARGGGGGGGKQKNPPVN